MPDFPVTVSDPRQVEDLRRAIEFLSLKAQSAQRALDEVNADIATIQAQITAITGDITTIETDITTLEGAVTALDVRIDTLETDLPALELRVDTLETDVTTLESDLGALATDVLAIDSRLSAAEATIVTHTGQIGTLNTSVTSLGSTVSSLSTTVSGHTSDISSINSTLSSLSSTVSGHTTSISTINSTLSSLASTDTSLDSRLDTIEGWTWGDGINKSGSTISVDYGQGIEVSSAAIRVKVLDPTVYTTQPLVRDSTGIWFDGTRFASFAPDANTDFLTLDTALGAYERCTLTQIRGAIFTKSPWVISTSWSYSTVGTYGSPSGDMSQADWNSQAIIINSTFGVFNTVLNYLYGRLQALETILLNEDIIS